MKLTTEQIEMLLDTSEKQVCVTDECCVQLVAVADLPSRFGDFQICGFISPCDQKEHTAIIKGDVVDKEGVVTRVHSECLTGDVMGSKRCDCRDQLESALEKIGSLERGILLYMRQEGRGIGLTNKARAYGLQDLGFDTVEANLALGFRDDEREYSTAAHMLFSLKVKSIQLMTNNPKKIKDLTKHGVIVNKRIPHIIPPNKYNKFYLDTKTSKSGHLLGARGMEHMQEQSDFPIIDEILTESVSTETVSL